MKSLVFTRASCVNQRKKNTDRRGISSVMESFAAEMCFSFIMIIISVACVLPPKISCLR